MRLVSFFANPLQVPIEVIHELDDQYDSTDSCGHPQMQQVIDGRLQPID
jgi:hypothetical protein